MLLPNTVNKKGSVKFGFEDGKMVITTEDTKSSLVPKASKSKDTPNPVFAVGKSPMLDLERSSTFHPWYAKALCAKVLFAKTLFAWTRPDLQSAVLFQIKQVKAPNEQVKMKTMRLLEYVHWSRGDTSAMESEVLSAFNGDTVFVVHEGSKSLEFMHLSVTHDDPKFLEVKIVHGV